MMAEGCHTVRGSGASAGLHHSRRSLLNNRSIPSSTAIPVLVDPDVRAAVAWLTDTFGFVEPVSIGEAHRAQMHIGDGGAMIVADVRGEQLPRRAGAVKHVVKVGVEDVDAQFARARAGGARLPQERIEYEYVERERTVEDFAGHRWHFTQSMRDVDPEEWGGESVLT
jgi:uncharacterized glyoxalase superfamily protein PhnB